MAREVMRHCHKSLRYYSKLKKDKNSDIRLWANISITSLVLRFWKINMQKCLFLHFLSIYRANVDSLKMVPVKILLNFGNYFHTLQLGFWKFLSGIVFLHRYVRTIGLFFSQAHSIWPKPRAFNPDRKSMGTPTFYCVYSMYLCTYLSIIYMAI